MAVHQNQTGEAVQMLQLMADTQQLQLQATQEQLYQLAGQ
jgi:hypothetical protein